MKPICIVDDDQSIRFVLEKALLRENLPTRSFTNPRDVLAALDSSSDDEGPQIMVSDIRMPGGSGLELLDSVKAKHQYFCVTMFKSSSDFGTAVSALQVSYLAMPATLDSIAALVTNPTPITEASLANGRKQYQINCAVCHGGAGAGDVGPLRFLWFCASLRA